jgi:crossover junction endodeoxyribonuclease RuvC
MLICGVDPGITGAIAIIESDTKFHAVYDMPTMPRNEKKLQVDAHELSRLLDQWEVDLVVIEMVSAMPNQGVVSMFNFGDSFGQVKGVVAALGIQTYFVRPQAWKKAAGLLKQDKEASRLLAIELFPDAPLDRKKDSGRAEALLVARFGRPDMAGAAI